MRDKANRVLLGLLSMAAAIFMFLLADAAMPDEVKWFMRWWLAGMAIVCYFVGAAYAAYLMHKRTKEQIQRMKEQIQREKEKSAELAARWNELNSEERRKRDVFDVLTKREMWVLSMMYHIMPSKFSYSGNMYDDCFDTLVREGIIVTHGDEMYGNETRHVCSIAIEWRAFVAKHASELPDPHTNIPR